MICESRATQPYRSGSMAGTVHPRVWSPEWGFAVGIIAIAVNAAAGGAFEDGQWTTGLAVALGTTALAATVLPKLAIGRGRDFGAMALALSLGFLMKDALKLRETLGFWPGMIVCVAVVMTVKIAFDLWLRRRDRLRIAP